MSKRAYDPISRLSKARPSKGAAPRPAPRGPKRSPEHGGMAGLLLDLQRTVGNQAVEQFLRRQAAQHEQEATRAMQQENSAQQPRQHAGEDGARPSIQRLMSFDEFKKATGQTASTGRRGIRGPSAAKRAVAAAAAESWTDILSGKTGEEALKADREKRGRSGTGSADINFHFEQYQNNPSLTNMINLYDKITYWETLYAGYKWADDLKPVLDKVKKQIEADVQAETEKQAKGDAKTSGGTLGKAKTAAGSLLSKGGRAARAGASATAAAMKPLLKEYPEWETGTPGQGVTAAAILASAATMPPFLKEVGVSQGYYDDYLKGHPEHIKALEAFYNGLNDGRLQDATSAYRKVSHLEGMYLIKPLFLSHFANKVDLHGLVGTDAKAMEGTPVSKEEEKAILTYTSEAYLKMNKQLREHTIRSAGRAAMGTQKGDARAATMRAAVSGLNKFPKFQGTAYRGLINVPSGFFAAVRPGGIMADLAFNSASSSMEGVGQFINGYGTGSKSVYFIIKTKTAVNIVGYAHSAIEGEVLFRPGTRFLVKAIWEQVNGKVPPGAPPQAQMILHSQGEEKWAGGKAGTYGDYYFKLQALKPDAPAEEIKKEAYATMQKEGVITKVKVVEIEEV